MPYNVISASIYGRWIVEIDVKVSSAGLGVPVKLVGRKFELSPQNIFHLRISSIVNQVKKTLMFALFFAFSDPHQVSSSFLDLLPYFRMNLLSLLSQWLYWIYIATVVETFSTCDVQQQHPSSEHPGQPIASRGISSSLEHIENMLLSDAVRHLVQRKHTFIARSRAFQKLHPGLYEIIDWWWEGEKTKCK